MTTPGSRLRPFSPEWFGQARALTAGVALPGDRSCRVAYRAGDERWHLVVERGRIAAWGPGAPDAPEVELRFAPADARRVLARELRGDDAMRATTVVAAAAGGTYVGPPAPQNLLGRPELDAMARVPGATLTVAYHFRHGPFGDVDHVLRFEDGLLVEQRFGTADAPDVRVDVPYRAIATVRAGEATILEALADGSVEGDIGPLATLAGILEDPAFRAAERATGRHAYALAVLGELDADPGFATSMTELAARTAWT